MFDILLLINLCISLTEHPIKEHRCKLKIDKITYLKSQCRTTYYVTKNKPSVYL